jgi:DNA-binding beta-propeller fold protein YncE
MTHPLFTSEIILLLLSLVNASTVLQGAEGSTGVQKGLLLVANKGDRTLGIIDPDKGTLIAAVPGAVLHTIPTGQPESHMLAITHDGRRGYTANVGPGTVSVLDLEAKKVLLIIPVSGRIQRISISTDDK